MTALILAALTLAVATVFAWRAWQRRIPNGWIVGPIIDGKNLSKGLPLRPTPQGSGWMLNVPLAAEPHYVTRNGAVRGPITVRYRVTGQFKSVDHPEQQASMSLHFQRKGDDWSAAGKFGAYRWYSLMEFPLTEGEHTATVSLERELWANVFGPDPTRQQFADAVANMARSGVTFGSSSGRGHGVRGPGAIELLEWNV